MPLIQICFDFFYCQKILTFVTTELSVTDTPPVQANGAVGDAGDSATHPTASKKALKLSYDDYKQIANLMVLYMRKQEEENDGKHNNS